MQLARYKGRGRIGNALIRWWKRSPYSHCELVIGDVCYSSSLMDGGVRAKPIALDPENWELIDLPWADPVAVISYFQQTRGQRYSWRSLLWSQVFNREYDEPRAAYCSDWCAAALGLPNATSHSPQTLGDLCLFLLDLAQQYRKVAPCPR